MSKILVGTAAVHTTRMVQTKGPYKGHIINCDADNTAFWAAEGYRVLGVFEEALSFDRLDMTVKVIQDALGITTGDVAGQCFSDDDRKTYAALESAGERAYFIKSWLGAELDDAAAAIDGSKS